MNKSSTFNALSYDAKQKVFQSLSDETLRLLCRASDKIGRMDVLQFIFSQKDTRCIALQKSYLAQKHHPTLMALLQVNRNNYSNLMICIQSSEANIKHKLRVLRRLLALHHSAALQATVHDECPIAFKSTYLVQVNQAITHNVFSLFNEWTRFRRATYVSWFNLVCQDELEELQEQMSDLNPAQIHHAITMLLSPLMAQPKETHLIWKVLKGLIVHLNARDHQPQITRLFSILMEQPQHKIIWDILSLLMPKLDKTHFDDASRFLYTEIARRNQDAAMVFAAWIPTLDQDQIAHFFQLLHLTRSTERHLPFIVNAFIPMMPRFHKGQLVCFLIFFKRKFKEYAASPNPSCIVPSALLPAFHALIEQLNKDQIIRLIDDQMNYLKTFSIDKGKNIFIHLNALAALIPQFAKMIRATDEMNIECIFQHALSHIKPYKFNMIGLVLKITNCLLPFLNTAHIQNLFITIQDNYTNINTRAATEEEWQFRVGILPALMPRLDTVSIRCLFDLFLTILKTDQVFLGLNSFKAFKGSFIHRLNHEQLNTALEFLQESINNAVLNQAQCIDVLAILKEWIPYLNARYIQNILTPLYQHLKSRDYIIRQCSMQVFDMILSQSPRLHLHAFISECFAEQVKEQTPEVYEVLAQFAVLDQANAESLAILERNDSSTLSEIKEIHHTVTFFKTIKQSDRAYENLAPRAPNNA